LEITLVDISRFFKGLTLVTATTFWKTATISSGFQDGHKTRFYFGGGYAERFYCIMRDCWDSCDSSNRLK